MHQHHGYAPSAPRPAPLMVSAHRVACGPYNSVRSILRHTVPLAAGQAPELVERHGFVIAYSDPALARWVPGSPLTLVETTPLAERTRFFEHGYVSSVSHGVIDFLDALSRRGIPGVPTEIAITDLDEADQVDLDFVTSALRRLDPGQLRLVIVTRTQDALAEQLRQALARWARPVEVEAAPEAEGSCSGSELTAEVLVAQALSADGRRLTPAQQAAYDAVEPGVRARLHDARADELAAIGDVGALVGPIPYHRERGTDPGGRGVDALLQAQGRCAAWGFSAAVRDFGLRGRSICDRVSREIDYLMLTSRAANAMVPLRDLDGCERLYREMIRETLSPVAHRTALYGLAMLHTRFLVPRDHDRALELLRTARVLAGTERDAVDRACVEVYEDNGIALVEMHRGRLEVALTLVSDGLDRLNALLEQDRLLVHRTQLLHNRARVLVALRRLDEALADFDQLVQVDRNYVEYRTDRANVYRKLGRQEDALRDYDYAIAHQPPFAELYFNRADIRAALGDPAGSEADLRAAVEYEPAMAEAWLNLGATVLERNDAEEAVRCARRGRESAPDDPGLWCLEAQAEAARANLDEAASLVDQALSHDDEYLPALALRAELHWLRGERTEALADVERALLADPELGYLNDLRHQLLGAADLPVPASSGPAGKDAP